jgi:hypothetical protein
MQRKESKDCKSTQLVAKGALTWISRNPCQSILPMIYLNEDKSRREAETGQTVPVMGFNFCSNARAFVASSHSLLMVRGFSARKEVQTTWFTTRNSYLPPTPQFKAAVTRPATPTKPRTEKNILTLSPGLLEGALGPCGPKDT